MPALYQSPVRDRIRTAGKITLAGALAILGTGGLDQAWAYIGDSFLSIPDEPGHWTGEDHKGWVRAEASEWQGRIQGPMSGPGDFLAGDKLWFGGPAAAKPGGSGGKIVLSFNKKNPDLAKLMKLCASKAELPEMSYAESSVRSRPVLENGPKPANLPDYWEYKFKGVQVVDCPILEGAEQQAVVITFKDIEWLNYDPAAPMGNRIVIPDKKIYAVLPAEPKPGKTIKSYLVTWIAPATDPGDEACPKLNTKPTEADIYRYMSPEDAAKLRARNGEKGITYGSDSEHRGPHKLSVSAFPGIVPDPVQIEPKTKVADGLDLDGNDGIGTPPKGIRKHENFVSPDGRKGIDNQLVRVWGCVTGFRGKRGYNNQTGNARRADGNIVTIVEISDIDDPQNDDDVSVALIHSEDKPVRDISGHQFIPGYSFRPIYDPNYAYYNVRVHGRIKDGVITTDVMPVFTFNPGQGPATEVFQARMRFEPRPDGSVRGLIGGYVDYRNRGFGGYGEGLFNFQTPSVYYSMRRNADGLYDPASGEYHGLSMAYEVDTVPAFLTPLSPEDLAATRNHAEKKPKP
ncbi:MAG TPA: hypothetical protein VF503_28050 [Sphingobium sp.]|uniref:hypothetical protein n=1 Tax=Sphingobium sp. TaxID=1912891 RepID=UPI002ED068C5